jgi:adenine-specific DNA-methyltransferase
MKLVKLSPKKALPKSLLAHRVAESDMKNFTRHLRELILKINEAESEENQKNPVRDFLKNTFYTSNEVNTKDRIDLAIHKSAKNDSPVAVIIEVKKPSNKNEMLSADKPNRKALQELVLYYLRERIDGKNTDIQYLIATNIYEWYIIEAKYFEDFFYANSKFRKEYEEWKIGKKSSTDTSFFYEHIAKDFIEKLDEELPCTFFDLRHFEAKLDDEQDESLQELYKILSPQHLLHQTFTNDSNELNDGFYRELLHIIGLEEVKDAGKSIIRRKAENRNNGSLLELVIDEIKTEGLHKIPDIQTFGASIEERQFNVALELCITWVNRILFLKLLEGQLLAYHDGEQSFRFLNSSMIHDFDELFKLFHKVLAVNVADRNSSIQQKYSKVPYLNSSLFEISELEDCSIKINALDNSEGLPFYSKTVLSELKNSKDKQNCLAYLFQFLDAYDFSGEGSKGIVKDNKALINASVLGKVFEKINGYKDGSVYTPAFITMYMCKQSLEMAVVEKFNETKGWNCLTFNDLENKDFGNQKDIAEANDLINSLKVCDPAVGSGHFLVSALNELLLIKYKLGILCDKNNQKFKKSDYKFDIFNDELIVTENGEKVRYNPKNTESQRLQETLFIEKQTIIENCLFGVDINPNSVKICRLRLWIELLKNAYYKKDGSLETLPNIDINIKCGNSLLSRFALDADLGKALKSIKYDIAAYRDFVQDYKNCKDRDAKRGLQQIIDSIKSDFRTEILKNDPKLLKLNKLGGELYNLTSQTSLFEDEKTKKVRIEKIAKLEPEIQKLTKEIDEVKTNATFKNAFEWRFEFPEILNDEGNFLGFDVVIGNPPYISLSKDANSSVYKTNYSTFEQSGDIYALFYELGAKVLKKQGSLMFITGSAWLKAGYGKPLRQFFVEKVNPTQLIDFSDCQIFDEATVLTTIVQFQNTNNQNHVKALRLNRSQKEKLKDLDFTFSTEHTVIHSFSENAWIITNDKHSKIREKVENQGIALSKWEVTINRGLLTGFNDAFYINEDTRTILIDKDKNSVDIIVPMYRGRDIEAFSTPFKNEYLINSHNGETLTLQNLREDVIEENGVTYVKINGVFEQVKRLEYIKGKQVRINRIVVENDYPAIFEHLKSYQKELEKRGDKGIHWSNLRSCAYLKEFEKPKIIYPNMTKFLPFSYDESGCFGNQKCYILTGKSLHYLLCFFNSTLFKYCFTTDFPELQGNTRELNKEVFDKIKVKQITIEEQAPFINLVDEILKAKSKGEATEELEKKIDLLLYALYELTEEEINVIKGKQ